MEDHLTKSITHSNNITTISPHVVIFPLPIQGPINCMLKLANLILSLSPATVSVTFVTTDFIHRRLLLHSNTAARLAHDYRPRFRFETVHDGFGPDENPRNVSLLTMSLEAQAQAEGSRLREVLGFGSAEDEMKKPVSCIIAEGLYGCMVDVAKELRVPLVYFDTCSPCCLWTYFCIPNLLKVVDLPFQDDEEGLDASITSVPGMETYLRRRDLPSFCHAYDPNNPVIQLVLKEAQEFPKAQGHILNTFDELEGDYFAHIRALCPNLYNIGPLHLNLKSRIQQETTKSISNSLWQEDRSCLAWLDAQPPKSVLFVSIGSLASMTKDQLMEIWHGLINSKSRFLWVRRPGSIINKDEDTSQDDLEMIPDDLVEGTKKRGCIVSWAPQEEVLAHGAIGGFLTHCGWNSTLESIVEGVPMICWPFYVDQQVNSRVVSEVWKIGLDMNKDNCTRVVVEELIKELMETRRDEFSKRADKMAKLAAQAVAEDGSSYNSLNHLIDDIVSMRFSI
ncbi:7-deoxyloganetic acid glucosyltransferase-like isoform X1 [Chenopodium quinoa]|uniref:7-deoxyloganetic acid glucosyltransferase-like isoform X1 n=1 Tax=Chenopodium quinoa TaxID=63459 RepID=UPI000B78E441|nr:7-deoxyloganetic acid glucosyltransferase-like isoform X1 [Chenopodium quinoa]